MIRFSIVGTRKLCVIFSLAMMRSASRGSKRGMMKTEPPNASVARAEP
jgi:hypothetical protein